MVYDGQRRVAGMWKRQVVHAAEETYRDRVCRVSKVASRASDDETRKRFKYYKRSPYLHFKVLAEGEALTRPATGHVNKQDPLSTKTRTLR